MNRYMKAIGLWVLMSPLFAGGCLLLGMPLPVACLVALACGALIGLLNA